MELDCEIDPLLQELVPLVTSDRQPIRDERWEQLVDALRQVERLAGSIVPGKARWRDMRRHMSIGQGVDLHDIALHHNPLTIHERRPLK